MNTLSHPFGNQRFSGAALAGADTDCPSERAALGALPTKSRLKMMIYGRNSMS